MSNILIGLKKTCLSVLDRGKRDKDNARVIEMSTTDRDKDNEPGLKEGGVIEMLTTVLPFAMLALFA